MTTIILMTAACLICVFTIMVNIYSIRWARIVFLRNYRLFRRSKFFNLIIDLLYEGGKALLATALIGGLFVPDDKITMKTLLTLCISGIISYTIGFYKKG